MGTDHLLRPGVRSGVRRFVSQSFAPYIYARTGTGLKTEEDPLDPDPPKGVGGVVDAVRQMEEKVPGRKAIEGIVLRYGAFYGEGTSMAYPDGEQVAPILGRKFPVVGDGGGVWSFVHVADAAEATVLALESDRTGIYNVVDDAPAPVRQWLPAVAQAIGAPPPRHAPRWIARLLTGEAGVVMMTGVSGFIEHKGEAGARLAAATHQRLAVTRGERRHDEGRSPYTEKTSEELQRHAFAIAYRMLGSVADAEDVAQEAMLRLHRVLADGERIESRQAYLSTVSTRLAIDELRSARSRRESYVGEWLPEPLVGVRPDAETGSGRTG